MFCTEYKRVGCFNTIRSEHTKAYAVQDSQATPPPPILISHLTGPLHIRAFVPPWNMLGSLILVHHTAHKFFWDRRVMQQTYKIGEAAALLNLKTYVLRFWETEFPQIAPLRTDKGQRLYTHEHIALLAYIRYLLHEKGLTIEGARKELLRGLPSPLPFPLLPPRQPSLLDEAPQATAAQGVAPSAIPQHAVSALPPPAATIAQSAQPAMHSAIPQHAASALLPPAATIAPGVQPGASPSPIQAMQPAPAHPASVAQAPVPQHDVLDTDTLYHLLDELEAVADLLRS